MSDCLSFIGGKLLSSAPNATILFNVMMLGGSLPTFATIKVHHEYFNQPLFSAAKIEEKARFKSDPCLFVPVLHAFQL
jgi:hypothetical protein